MDILISIIVPVYNTQKYLIKCMDSIVENYNGQMEVILVDDGSTDGSSKKCDELVQEYSFVKVIHKENQGLGLARNSGITIAKGKYIWFIDSDDWIPSGSLHALLEILEKDASDIICFNYTITKNRDYKIPLQNDYSSKILKGNDILIEYLTKMSATAWTKIYKRDIFSNFQFTNISLHEDAYSMHLFINEAEQITVTNYIGYIQYIREGSLIQSNFSNKNFIVAECGQRIVEFISNTHCELLPYAHLNYLKRLVYLQEIMIRKSAVFKYHKEYLDTIKKTKQEYNYLKSFPNVHEELNLIAKKAVKSPIWFFIRIYLSTKYSKLKELMK